MGDCPNYGPFLGPLNKAPYYNRDPKRDHNFDNPPCIIPVKGSGFINLGRQGFMASVISSFRIRLGLGFRV